MIVYSQCPVCGSMDIKPVFNVKDHTVSGQSFPVEECQQCTARFTNDIPSEEEIGAYYRSDNYVSHTETTRGLVNRLYHVVRKRTLQQKYKLVAGQSGKRSGLILDLGCGTGAFLEVMKSRGWMVKGLEPDEGARKIAEGRGVDVSGISQFFHLPEKAFDVITMWHVLEHVHRLHEYFVQLARILKDDGVLIIAVPNYTCADAVHYGASWAAYDVPRHLYHFSPRSMEVLTAKHGFSVVETRPMWFDSFYVSMLSEGYRSQGRMGLVSAAWQGALSNVNAWSDTSKCSSIIYVIRKVS